MPQLVTSRQPALGRISTLFSALNESGILYCSLKGNDEHLRFSASGQSDVDVLVDENQKDELRSVLQELGFKEFVAIKEKRFRGIVDFLAPDEATGKIIHLHTHYALAMGEPYLKPYQPRLAGQILHARIFNEDYGLYCIHPAHELVLLFIAETLKLRHRDFLQMRLGKRTSVSRKVTTQYNWLKERTSPEEIGQALRLLVRNPAAVERLAASELNPAMARTLYPMVKSEFSSSREYSPLGSLFQRWRREVAVIARRRLSRLLSRPVLSLRTDPRGGAVIALMGDNPGVLSVLRRSLQETFGKKLDVYRVAFPAGTKREQAHDFSASGRPIVAPRRWLKRTMTNAAMRKKLSWIDSARKAGVIVICENYPDDLLHLAAESDMQARSGNHSTTGRAVPDLICRISEDVESALPGEGIIQDGGRGGRPRIIVADSGMPANALLPLLTKEIWNLL